MSVMPICTVDRNLSGSPESARAARAGLLPLRASVSSLDLRADTNAISDIERMPFRTISSRMITISIVDLKMNDTVVVSVRCGGEECGTGRCRRPEASSLFQYGMQDVDSDAKQTVHPPGGGAERGTGHFGFLWYP